MYICFFDPKKNFWCRELRPYNHVIKLSAMLSYSTILLLMLLNKGIYSHCLSFLLVLILSSNILWFSYLLTCCAKNKFYHVKLRSLPQYTVFKDKFKFADVDLFFKTISTLQINYIYRGGKL